MDKLIKVLGVMTIFFLAVIVLDSTGFFDMFALSNADNIRDIVEERIPDFEESDVELLDECEICTDGVCTTYIGPCWVAIVIFEDDEGIKVTEIVMDEAGGILSENTRLCTEWWCDSDPCSYIYSEQSDAGSIVYENKGCEDTTLVCDEEFGKCRPCLTGIDCIAKTEEAGPGGSTFTFEVIRTGERAVIYEPEGICRIYSRGNLIYTQAMDVSSCGFLMYDNTLCLEQSCDFVPMFDLIPS